MRGQGEESEVTRKYRTKGAIGCQALPKEQTLLQSRTQAYRNICQVICASITTHPIISSFLTIVHHSAINICLTIRNICLTMRNIALTIRNIALIIRNIALTIRNIALVIMMSQANTRAEPPLLEDFPKAMKFYDL